MKPQLQVKTFDPKTLIWWNSRRAKIDMNPPYQRHGRIWSPSDKAYLIDSIINGFDIPKLYMADFTYGDSSLNIKKLPYAIVDGKQRLEAIFDFFDNQITLNEDFIYLKNSKLKLGGLGYKDLKQGYPEIAEEFDNANLTIMSVISNSEDLINDLFVRLNRSKPLTGAEIRNAMTGPAIQIIRRIAEHDFFMTNVSFSTKRMTDQDTAAKILLHEFHEKLLETKRVNLDEFVKDTASNKKDKDKDRLELAGRRVIETLDDMATVFLPKDRLLSLAGIVPVYYWLIRSLSEEHFTVVRSFLVRVEEQRKITQKLITMDPLNNEIDQELVQLNNFYRNPNDASSHEGRFRILHDRFLREYRASK